MGGDLNIFNPVTSFMTVYRFCQCVMRSETLHKEKRHYEWGGERERSHSQVLKKYEVEPKSTSEPQTGVKSYPKVIMQLE